MISQSASPFSSPARADLTSAVCLPVMNFSNGRTACGEPIEPFPSDQKRLLNAFSMGFLAPPSKPDFSFSRQDSGPFQSGAKFSCGVMVAAFGLP